MKKEKQTKKKISLKFYRLKPKKKKSVSEELKKKEVAQLQLKGNATNPN